MDAGDPIVGMVESHQSEVPNSGIDSVMEKVGGVLNSTVECEGLDESTVAVCLLGKTGNFESLSEKDIERSTFLKEFIGLTIAKESRQGDDTNSMDNSKKVQDRGTAIRHSNLKSVVTSVEKDRDENFGSVTLKKPFALATKKRSSNDRQIAGTIRSIHSTGVKKVASAASAACHSLQSGQSCTTLPALSTTEPESLREQAKHKPPAKVEENTHSASSSPAVESAKPQRVGHLPSYGFSFKCDERAQRRKEFHLKLEDKTHAKEVEKSTFQAKSKESQEVEVKMLRRSLTFKATPMPSFYHEPAPPKVEFKKIAPTRARSPKLGRHKRSSMTASEVSSNRSSRSGRLSLDEKVTQNRATKESSLDPFKKPLRKSLPRLVSEQTTLANSPEDATFLTPYLEQHKVEQEAGQISEPSQSQTGIDAIL